MHFKPVAGRKTRQWQDKEAIAEHLQDLGLTEDEYAPRSLVTPAAAEKILKGKKITDEELPSYVMDRTGNPTLALVTDKRPRFNVSDDGVFDEE